MTPHETPPRRILFGRTYWYEFTRDDGAEVSINYKLAPYFSGYGPSWDDPGCPPEGGEIEDWIIYAEGGGEGGQITLTDAEASRAEAEIYALPWNPYDEDDQP